MRDANFTYKEQFGGPPGRYTIEAAVLDLIEEKHAPELDLTA